MKILLTIFIVFNSLFWAYGETVTIDDSRVVKDQAGRQVIIPKAVERVTSTYRPATMIVYALGGHRKLTPISSTPGSFFLLEKLNPVYRSYKDIGSKRSGVNIEGVLATNPDLVILFPTKEGVETATRFGKLGVASIVVDLESIPKLFDAIKLTGKALDLVDEADKLVFRLQTYLELIQKRTSKLTQKQRKRVYFAAPRGITTTSSTAMMQHSMIEYAGGIDVVTISSGGWLNVSPEQLQVWDPDFIFLSRTCKTDISEIISDSRFSSLIAVKNKRVYRFPSNLNPWDYPSAENVLAIFWISTLLYPDLYTDIVFSDIVDTYYLEVYGQRFSDLGGTLE